MAKLNAMKYKTKKDDQEKINCYRVLISKETAELTNINAEDELNIYPDAGKRIIIERKN